MCSGVVSISMVAADEARPSGLSLLRTDFGRLINPLGGTDAFHPTSFKVALVFIGALSPGAILYEDYHNSREANGTIKENR